MRKQEIISWNKNELLVSTFNLLYNDAFADFKEEVKQQKNNGNEYVNPGFEIIEKKVISFEYLSREMKNNRRLNDHPVCNVDKTTGAVLIYYIDSDDFLSYMVMLNEYIVRNLMLVSLIKGESICDNFDVNAKDFKDLPSYWFNVMMEIKCSPSKYQMFDNIIYENFIHEYEENHYNKIDDNGMLFYASTMCMLGDIRANLCRIFPIYSDCIFNLTAKCSRLISYAIENSIQCKSL